MTADGTQVYDERNLVILSRFPILDRRQYKPEDAPWYRKVTADPPETQAKEVTWERPLLYAAEGAFLSSMKRVGQALQTRKIIDALFDADAHALFAVCGDFNADHDEVPVAAIRGDVENTNNPQLATRVLVPCERTIPEPARFSLLHQGKGTMLNHILVSRSFLAHYRSTEIHNELLHDESAAFATDDKFPESDHAPVIAEFAVPEG